MQLNLENVAIATVATRHFFPCRTALYQMQMQAQFSDIIVFTDQIELFLGYNLVEVKYREYKQWCVWRLTELPKFRDKMGLASHMLFVESDSAIAKPDAWTNSFLEYDYIGAPWLDGVQGNGGFVLYSYRLLEALEALNIPATETACHPSDMKICRVYRRYFENQGIKFAPLKVAQRFSSEQGPYTDSFGVHNYHGCQQKVFDESNKL